MFMFRPCKNYYFGNWEAFVEASLFRVAVKLLLGDVWPGWGEEGEEESEDENEDVIEENIHIESERGQTKVKKDWCDLGKPGISCWS